MSVQQTTFGHYHMEYIVVRSPALRYEYALSTISSSHEQKRFDDLAILGMYSLKPEHQPEHIAEVFRRPGRGRWSEADMEAVEDWKPPKDVGWVYHDAEMMAMIKARYAKECTEERTDGDA